MAWIKWVGGAGFGGVSLVAAAVGYAAITAEGKLEYPDTPLPELTVEGTPEQIARGEYLVRGPAHCASCHSTTDRSRPDLSTTAPMDGGLEFAMGPLATTWASNLTPHPEHGIGRYSDAELARAIRHGVRPNGSLSVLMRLAPGELADDDIEAVIAYLRAQEPSDNAVPEGEWYLFGKLLLAYAFPTMEPREMPPINEVPVGEGPSVETGNYLIQVAACTNCHTGFDMGTMQFVGETGGGGLPEPSHGEGEEAFEFVAPNLTSHSTGITGKLDEEAFVARMRAGRAYAASIMPWENFGTMSDDDLRSIYRALEALPPIDNETGPSYRAIGSYP